MSNDSEVIGLVVARTKERDFTLLTDELRKHLAEFAATIIFNYDASPLGETRHGLLIEAEAAAWLHGQGVPDDQIDYICNRREQPNM